MITNLWQKAVEKIVDVNERAGEITIKGIHKALPTVLKASITTITLLKDKKTPEEKTLGQFAQGAADIYAGELYLLNEAGCDSLRYLLLNGGFKSYFEDMVHCTKNVSELINLRCENLAKYIALKNPEKFSYMDFLVWEWEGVKFADDIYHRGAETPVEDMQIKSSNKASDYEECSGESSCTCDNCWNAFEAVNGKYC